MPDSLVIVLVAAGGALVAWLVARSNHRATETRLDERSKECERLRQQLVSAERSRADVAASNDQRLQQIHKELTAALEDCSRLTAELEAERTGAAEKLALLQDAEVKLREAFKALSAEALSANNQSFLDLAKTKLEQHQESADGALEARQLAIAVLVKPIEDSLKKVDERLAGVEKERVDAYAELRTHVETMARGQQQLQAETSNLVRALRTPHVRGQWGEIQLRRVVEMAGMVEQCDFVEQESTSTDQGTIRPDLVIRLPGGKAIVVDSKAPLSAYIDAMEATDDPTKEAFLLQHAKQVRSHIESLAGKGYWNQFPSAPDFVVMFLPGESFFSAACQCDPGLIDFAVSQHVIPASPTTLITLLKTVQFGWRQERIAESAQQISTLGRELYDRLRVLGEHMERCGRGLQGAVEHYNKAVGSLESRVLVSARKFRELGSGSTDDISVIEAIDISPKKLQADDWQT